MERENVTQATWNKKRIFIAIFLIILIGIGAYFFKKNILEEKINLFATKSPKIPESVKGVNVKEDQPSTNIQKAVKEKIEELRQRASGIDVTEIASSSPQIQKLIRDLSSIKDYPVNQAKEICEKVCGNL